MTNELHFWFSQIDKDKELQSGGYHHRLALINGKQVEYSLCSSDMKAMALCKDGEYLGRGVICKGGASHE